MDSRISVAYFQIRVFFLEVLKNNLTQEFHRKRINGSKGDEKEKKHAVDLGIYVRGKRVKSDFDGIIILAVDSGLIAE